ncbi:MAG: GerMN domain-containing protein [Clostridiales bacterium]|nr:GerMN domain-containing protein [Clostridiales bacterium]
MRVRNWIGRLLAGGLALAVTALAGCASLPLDMRDAGEAVALPTPDVSIAPAPTGDSRQADLLRVNLYYPTADGAQLTEVPRFFRLSGDETLAHRAVRALLADPPADGLARVAAEGTQLLALEQSGDVAVVNLSVDALNVDDEQALYRARAAIVATLGGLDGIRWVDLLIDGRQEGLLGLPVGVGQADDAGLPAGWAALQAQAAQPDQPVERTAIVYCAARGGRFLAPEARPIASAGADHIPRLIEELLAQPRSGALLAPLPGPNGALSAPPELVKLPDGRAVAQLQFDENLLALLDEADVAAWQMYGALCLTLTGFIPELDGIQAYVGAGQVARLELPGGALELPGGVMRRGDFAGAFGRMARLYFAEPEGGLVEVGRVMNQKDAGSPRALLAALIAGPMPWEAGRPVVPEGIDAGDLLGVRVEGGEAAVNLSSNFYRYCQGLPEQGERDLVYAMVNTLTGLTGINRARFYVEGEPVDTLVGAIHLRGPLLPLPLS